MPWASEMDAAGDQADIAKTYENRWFSMVLEGLKMILEVWRGSGVSCWHTGWQKAGWLADGLAGGGWCWLGGWLATGTPGAEGKLFVWGGPEPKFIKKPSDYSPVD